MTAPAVLALTGSASPLTPGSATLPARVVLRASLPLERPSALFATDGAPVVMSGGKFLELGRRDAADEWRRVARPQGKLSLDSAMSAGPLYGTEDGRILRIEHGPTLREIRGEPDAAEARLSDLPGGRILVDPPSRWLRGVRAIDAASGDVRWRHRFSDYVTSVFGDVVLTEPRGKSGEVLLALDADTGERLWRRDAAPSESIVAFARAGETLWCFEGPRFIALDARTGKERAILAVRSHGLPCVDVRGRAHVLDRSGYHVIIDLNEARLVHAARHSGNDVPREPRALFALDDEGVLCSDWDAGLFRLDRGGWRCLERSDGFWPIWGLPHDGGLALLAPPRKSKRDDAQLHLFAPA